MPIPKRIFQFSLKHFLLFVVITSLPLGWLSLQLGATQRESALVAEMATRVEPITEIRRPPAAFMLTM